MIDYGGHTQAGPRSYNEDAYAIRDLSAWSPQLSGLLVFAMVSDGMGGHEAGDVASTEATHAAERYVDELVRTAEIGALTIDPATVLVEIGHAANDAVLRAGAERGVQSMGATLVAMLATSDTAWIGHVGDSRAYRLSREGATQLTADHSAVGRMIAEGVLTEEQAQTHPQRNVIERALGFDDDRPIEIDTVGIQPHDVILLCSDGVSTALTGPDMRDIVLGSKSLGKAAASVVAEALAAGGDDNATAVVWSADFASRGVGTLPGGRGGRRVMSAQRREAKRHGRAQRAFWVAAGVLGLAVLALVVIGGNVFGPASGGTVGGAAGKPLGSKPVSSTQSAVDVTRTPPPPPSTSATWTVKSEHESQRIHVDPSKNGTDVVAGVKLHPGDTFGPLDPQPRGAPKGWALVYVFTGETALVHRQGWVLQSWDEPVKLK